MPVLGVECLGHCDLAPVAHARRRVEPEVVHRTNDGPSLDLAQRDATLADYEARGGLTGPPRRCPQASRIVEELKASGLAGLGGAGFPTGVKWEAVAAEAGPALRRRQRRRGRARDDQGPLRHGASAAPHARGDADRDALRRGDRGAHLPPRGVRDGARPARSTRSTSSARPGLLDGLELDARRRRRRLHLRRGDRDARVDGGPPRHAAPEAALPEPGRLPRPPDAHQQRRDAGAHPGDPPAGRRGLGGARHARREGRSALVDLRRGRGARLLRGAERLHAPRAHRRLRRRRDRGDRRDRPGRRGERDPARRTRSTCRSRATTCATGARASARPACRSSRRATRR